MKQLFRVFYRHLAKTDLNFQRYLKPEIDWNNRLTAITGARGSGKTTMLLQHVKEHYGNEPEAVLYASLDNIYFSANTLYALADEFYLNGGETLFLDEVHKYANWAQEIKNIYDDFPRMKVVFTGSSMLKIFQANADLSRRVRHYQLFGMSFREFLIYEGLLEKEQTAYSLEEILKNHIAVSNGISRKIKIIPAFKNYLRYGYYPYFREDIDGYHERVMHTFNTIVESDLPAVENIDLYSVGRIKKLFYTLSTMVPFTPNISQLSQTVDITRGSLINYLTMLEKAHSVLLLNKEATALRQMVKPDKIYLQNTNYVYAMAADSVDTGNVRETFFYNQLQVNHQVCYTERTDFLIDKRFYFEIGGRSKSQEQIRGLPNAFLALDDIETGYKNEIPLWLFGFLY